MTTTLLVLSGIGVPPYSARGLTQTLEPIEAAGNLRRTINGKLKDLSVDQFKKYHSSITGIDHNPPAVDGVWEGKVVTVDCVAELCYPEGGSPARTVVDGSSRTENGFVFYRPRLTMIVTGFSSNQDEWQASVNWTMDLEEQG